VSLSAAQKLHLIHVALKRGSICHWQQPFGPHFAIILNNVWPPQDDVVFFSIMTSKTSKYPSLVDNEIIRTGPHEYSFLTVPTVIDLRVVHSAKLSLIVTQSQFSPKGTLLPEHLQLTNEILRKSVTVEAEIIARVVA
jgi:hypothetical protein